MNIGALANVGKLGGKKKGAAGNEGGGAGNDSEGGAVGGVELEETDVE
jgi:hypothetical protein